ncbi:dTDP-4-dehydrorhamnose reductase [Caproiciproducens galactitolivorans]|uniref:dTDP-4-dehydrorhamnose reductase n=1 Tax=Caproiciproducens galactitolivorans TaxID=642589 RepID=UPI00240A75E1|nr:dTDP-4-dehydrorhamnose reductase [Caproiciproducens galactitolivorans]
MKLLVTGARGQLGSSLVDYSRQLGISCIGVGREDFDVTDQRATIDFISGCWPDAVIHCASYNAVDRAEEEHELCFRVNVEGTANVATACSTVHAKMMYISTDYVFDGTKPGFYEADDPVNPLSVYGKSKVAGEIEVQKRLKDFFIVRTSWLFGKNGNNFVRTIFKLSQTEDRIPVVNDQFGSPTYSADLVPLLLQMIQNENYGFYHATNEGFCSWAEFAEEIMRITGSSCKIDRISSGEYPSRASRPKNSRLSKRSLTENGYPTLPNWRDALARFLSEIL